MPYSGARVSKALVRGLVKDSPLESAHAKALLAQAAGLLSAQLRDLEHRLATGTISAEEQRAIPAVASNLRRMCESLKVTVEADEDDGLGV
ncbi:MAG: hypothetical protein RL139_906 [Gemmatimonadota bacterium]